jgi:deoxyribonuclease-4
MSAKIGPSGLGSVKEAVNNLERLHSKGLSACELAFTYSIYIKEEKDARKIGEKAKSLGIDLSIHAPYWINLNSIEPEKIEKSKERILNCLKVGTWLQAKRVVFHPGYYGKMSKEETYKNIRDRVKEIIEESHKRKYTTKLAPEMMGRLNVFGSIDEIINLKKDTGCDMCVDFAHVLARNKSYMFKEVLEKLKEENMREVHIHFSGIEYGEKGEKRHKPTEEKEWVELFKAVKKHGKGMEFVIISESPDPEKDSILAKRVYKSF